jgi:putative transposase
MSQELNFDSHNVVLAMSEVKDLFRMHFEQGCRYVAKRIYNQILAVDFESWLVAGQYERTAGRRDWRNGTRCRSLLTSVGQLELTVPRARQGGWTPPLFEKYRRIDRHLSAMIRETFLKGVSTGKVGDVVEVLCHERVSASYVSTVVKELDEAVRAYHHRPLDDDFVFLFLDGLSVRIKVGVAAKRYMLLVAYGIRHDGSREVIAFQKVPSESARCWQSFLDDLKARGLYGRNLRLITMDGSLGLWAAVEEVYPHVDHQLCWVHKLRNVASYCTKGTRRACLREAVYIMTAPSGGVAANRFREWKGRWQGRLPKAVACLERDFDKLIPIFSFPAEIRRMIRTTNVIERSFREVRRRLKVMGYFQNGASCQRIVYAVFAHMNKKWQRHTERNKTIKSLYQHAA